MAHRQPLRLRPPDRGDTQRAPVLLGGPAARSQRLQHNPDRRPAGLCGTPPEHHPEPSAGGRPDAVPTQESRPRRRPAGLHHSAVGQLHRQLDGLLQPGRRRPHPRQWQPADRTQQGSQHPVRLQPALRSRRPEGAGRRRALRVEHPPMGALGHAEGRGRPRILLREWRIRRG
ncbi:hypothetical protein SDC9_160857 [bioreactor metagenome]|uniref:Uncharacterized protein n=1 Tax=bioreactor metagenome TaxID=1076179 RepID=A0A645FIR7_9ZZZZ